MSKPIIKTIWNTPTEHVTVSIRCAPDTDEISVCGDTSCDGDCGYPAAVLTRNGEELKLRSNMTACGPVMQRWAASSLGAQWRGHRHQIPAEWHEDMLQRMWW